MEGNNFKIGRHKMLFDEQPSKNQSYNSSSSRSRSRKTESCHHNDARRSERLRERQHKELETLYGLKEEMDFSETLIGDDENTDTGTETEIEDGGDSVPWINTVPAQHRFSFGPIFNLHPSILAQVPHFNPKGGRKRMQEVVEMIYEDCLDEDDVEFSLDDLENIGDKEQLWGTFSHETRVKVERITKDKDPNETFKEHPIEKEVVMNPLKKPVINVELELEDDENAIILVQQIEQEMSKHRTKSRVVAATIVNLDPEPNIEETDLDTTCSPIKDFGESLECADSSWRIPHHVNSSQFFKKRLETATSYSSQRASADIVPKIEEMDLDTTCSPIEDFGASFDDHDHTLAKNQPPQLKSVPSEPKKRGSFVVRSRSLFDSNPPPSSNNQMRRIVPPSKSIVKIKVSPPVNCYRPTLKKLFDSPND